MSYKNLEIYQLAYDLAIRVHHMSLSLPKYELYEQGSQIRRTAQRIKDTIAEGYGRKRYKDEYVRFLTFAHSSCDEVLSQLNMISDIYFREEPLNDLIDAYNKLGGKINRYIVYVESHWKPSRKGS
jgi:four helix bundle protein